MFWNCCLFQLYCFLRYYQRRLCPSFDRFPSSEIPSLDVFWKLVVERFSPATRSTHDHAVSAGGLPRPLEAQYSDEFYRSSWQLLGERSFLTAEWGGMARACDTGGRIDYVVRGVGWGIELVRDGDNLKGHLARFEAGGAYNDWILGQDLTDWVVVDFRQTIPIPMSRTWIHLLWPLSNSS